MTTYYLDTNSGFFYKIINSNTCSIEGWASKYGTTDTTGVITNPTIKVGLTSSSYNVTIITSISNTNFIQSRDSVNTISGAALQLSNYIVSPFTKITLTIPDSVTSIDPGAFSACNNLTSIIYSGSLTNAIIGSTGTSPLIQYAETGKTTLVKYFQRGSTATSYTIPSGITMISRDAFDEPLLTSIIYSGNLTSAIGSTGASPLIQYAETGKTTFVKYFQRSSPAATFKSDDYPKVNSILPEAFTSISNLYKIIINSDITIAKNAFVNCSNLKGIVISSPCTLQQSIISTLQQSIISNSTLEYVLISSSTTPVIIDTTNAPSDSNPVFSSSILASSNYCVVSKENSASVDTLFGTSTKVHIEDATNPPTTDTQTRVYIRPATYNSIKIALVGESNDIASVSTSIDFDTQVDTDNALAAAAAADARTAASAAALVASTQLNSANTATSEREAKLLRAIQAKVRAIDAAITDITGEQSINNRKMNYFSQDKYINMYVNRIGLILYYIVFILLALSFYYNRESYSIVMIVISLIVFALLPFVIKYITRFAYEQFLGLLKVFYKGNALYLDP
jgi:hypothetical protein